jgi:hypothetical protein
MLFQFNYNTFHLSFLTLFKHKSGICLSSWVSQTYLTKLDSFLPPQTYSKISTPSSKYFYLEYAFPSILTQAKPTHVGGTNTSKWETGYRRNKGRLNIKI